MDKSQLSTSYGVSRQRQFVCDLLIVGFESRQEVDEMRAPQVLIGLDHIQSMPVGQDSGREWLQSIMTTAPIRSSPYVQRLVNGGESMRDEIKGVMKWSSRPDAILGRRFASYPYNIYEETWEYVNDCGESSLMCSGNSESLMRVISSPLQLSSLLDELRLFQHGMVKKSSS